MSNREYRQSRLVAVLRRIETQITAEVDDLMHGAGRCALEALDAQNQDAGHQLIEARRLKAEAAGLRAARVYVRQALSEVQ